MNTRTQVKSAQKAADDAATTAMAALGCTQPKTSSKQDRLITMLVSDGGATLQAMVEATGWQSHTVRAALTGLRKRDFAISSDKHDGVRTYRAVAPE